MAQPRVARYGSWKSPITSEIMVSESIGLSQIVVDRGNTYWIESYPNQNGRLAVVRLMPDGAVEELTRLPFVPRSRVHEYGGASYAVKDEVLYFANLKDQRIYRQAVGRAEEPNEGEKPRAITPEGAMRFADFALDGKRGLLYCVREDHEGRGESSKAASDGERDGEAANTLVMVRIAGDEQGGEVVVEGSDFYASPRLSPDASLLAWLSWSHPNMPWDGCELWVGELHADGSIGRRRLVAGGPAESIFQPEWSPEGTLYFVSDRSGWWNLYRLRDPLAEGGSAIEAIAPMEAEFGRPLWYLGDSTYAFLAENLLACTFLQNGISRLALIDTQTLSLRELESPYTAIAEVRADAGRILFFGASESEQEVLVRLDPDTCGCARLRRSSVLDLDPAVTPVPEEIRFPGYRGEEAYAFFYPPRNDGFRAPAGELPPLVVMSHGGPTASSSSALKLGIVFWTSRGFGVLDVNYGGSSGYGRAFRRRLEGGWGVVDVEDCMAGVRALIERGAVDAERVVVRGGSAGGYTTLCALTFHDLFKAGASYYGVSDLESLARDTHKFESRYLERLIGPYPARADLYRERSPIHFVDRLSCPLILFQGSDDKVVPPEQSRIMYEAVRSKGLPVAYIEFEGEQHGFRRAENLRRSIDAELYFYSRLFGFTPGNEIDPVRIENLEEVSPKHPEREGSG